MDNYTYERRKNMIYFIKKYFKYIFTFFICIMLFVIVYENNNNIEKVSAKENNSITKKEVKKESDSTVFVDVKGAVNNPGVYELESGKRVINAINKAGGLSSNANSININLSKKLTDEMVIIVYTKNEILNYKNGGNTKAISCASNECICPDSNNDACISKTSSGKSSGSKVSTNNSNSKVSINSASKEELMTLNGVGEAKAQKIIEYREKNGQFKSIEDIKNVSGIGDSMYEKIKDNITL